jgi:predicted glycosyltransferase involved in capsule biosynthesis
MNPKYSFTFIIGYRHIPDRLKNLRRTIDWVNAFSGSQVIVVEQDENSKIENLNLRCQHIFVKSEMPYNRSWAFNIGLKYAKSEIIVFGDSDLIMNPDDFINGLKAMNEYEMVSPYHSVVDLTPEESNMDLQSIVNINRPGRGETDNQKINISGGIAIFRRDAILKIGGWSEDFIGWGGEDDFQTIKVNHFLKWVELKARCYHLYHQRSQPDKRFYQRSLSILKKADNMPKDELWRTIESSRSKIGMLNKYADYRKG